MNPAAAAADPPALPDPRRHDLDALRAAAMLLGILYHAALAYAAGFGWMIEDPSRSTGLYLFQAAVHGFRMPLFFVVSGFFTALLWRKRGLSAVWKNRLLRIFLPCLIGLVTLVPAMGWASGSAMAARFRLRKAAETARTATADVTVWSALASGDVAALDRVLARKPPLDVQQPESGIVPLTLVALQGREDLARRLLDAGASVHATNRDGNTPLHAAVFLGRTGLVELLLARGANVHARSVSGESTVQPARADWAATEFIAGLFGVKLDRAEVEAGRAVAVRRLTALGVEESAAGQGTGEAGRRISEVFRGLIDTPVFIVVWFLWFLCWLLPVFSAYAWLARRFGWGAPPRWLVLGPARWLVWVPLVLVPQAFMTWEGTYGPDTSMGLVPMPHVLAYYLLFFAFGVLYHEADDSRGELGRGWRWLLPVSLLVLLPLGVEAATGHLRFRDRVLPPGLFHVATVLLQGLYAWAMTFGCIGAFREWVRTASPRVRYLSDSAYWLYLGHLPLVIWAQGAMADWPLPGWLKCLLISAAVTGLLLAVYEWGVRYTWVGAMLNGRKLRKPSPPAPGSAAVAG
ncbi:MAG: hypothetical protein FJ396_08670 [Verrucomicrobia bacterium]|nr:hypothetical protein [Verrucomicrobiota bacterium]